MHMLAGPDMPEMKVSPEQFSPFPTSRRRWLSLGLIALAACAAWAQEATQPDPSPPDGGDVGQNVVAEDQAAAPPAVQSETTPAPRTFHKPVLIRFQGEITPLLEHFIRRKLQVAKKEQADLVIIEIDSPGGFLDESLELADTFLRLEDAHTVAFIPREALSGAAIAALGCDDIVMAPDAHLGDAGPIFLGEDALFRHAPEKIRSELALKVRDLAEATGRPPALAEAMVDMDLAVYRTRNKENGRESFMSEHEIASSAQPDQWERLQLVHESGEKRFLTVTGKRAVELKLADGLAATRQDLKTRYRLPEEMLVLEPTGLDTTVMILNLPVVAGFLIVIGLIAAYVELSAPGIGAGSVVAAICFGVFFWSKFLYGTAAWLEVVLFALGVVFLFIELFITPGFGVLGISGLILVFGSLLMASQHFVIPETTRELNTMLRGLLVIVGAGFAFLIGATGVTRYFGTLPLVRSLALDLPSPETNEAAKDSGQKQGAAPTSARFAVSIGDWGVAESPLRPAGKGQFGENFVDVVADGSFVDAGRQIRVIDISGNRVVVREIEEAT